MENSEASLVETNQEQYTVAPYGESLMNLALFDPPRWGWTAAGTIVDLLPPHEVCIPYLAAVGGCVRECVLYTVAGVVVMPEISHSLLVVPLPVFSSCCCCLVEITSSEHGSSLSQA